MFIPPDNLAYPVMISIGETTGSGFYCNTANGTYIATAKHVLFKNDNALIADHALLTSVGTDLVSPIVMRIDCSALLNAGDLRRHANADVAVGKIAGAPNEAGVIVFQPGVTRQNQVPVGVGILGLAQASFRRFEQVEISNETIMFGYPASLGLGQQLDHTRPLLRRGMVAGKTNDQRIVLDCPCYFGNSGGLIIEVDEVGFGQRRFRGIGLAVQMVPFVEELRSVQYQTVAGVRFENSGYSLVEPIDRVEELFDVQPSGIAT